MNKGFTLIELLIVVAIIGILAAVGAAVIPNILENTKKTALNENCQMAKLFIRAQLLRCEIGDKISTWTGLGTGALHDRDCDTTDHKFVQNFGYAMNVLENDTSSYKNPFNSKDRAFNQNWDPPLPINIGRVHCGIKGSLKTNPIMCYCRWGSGVNDYDTVHVQSP